MALACYRWRTASPSPFALSSFSLFLCSLLYSPVPELATVPSRPSMSAELHPSPLLCSPFLYPILTLCHRPRHRYRCRASRHPCRCPIPNCCRHLVLCPSHSPCLLYLLPLPFFLSLSLIFSHAVDHDGEWIDGQRELEAADRVVPTNGEVPRLVLVFINTHR